jgi:hypothetical protein
MHLRTILSAGVACAALGLVGCTRHTPEKMTFFVTSTPAGAGGAIGGLEGADAHCQRLADAAGSKGRTWRAYLSAAAAGGKPAVNARDRIGHGPWFNARGIQIATSLEDLHSPNNHINRNTAFQEHGNRVGFPHDMLTGSNPDGTVASGDATCRNWTSTIGQAMLGHSDRAGGLGRDSNSWNSAHPSEGCTSEAFGRTGGSGLFYCFAIN